MAKRKRLTPARLQDSAAPETKSALARPALTTRPPIADVAHDAAASAALSEVAGALTAARSEGRLIQKLPLDAIDPDHLVRDRVALDPAEMQVLVDSISARGQQTAIEVAELDGGGYGLISGFRRYAALRIISAKSPEIDSILAIVRRPDDGADAYLAMVEENEIRSGLSFYERGRIVARAADAGIFADDTAALGALFGAVPRARRSKIKSFVGLVRRLDDVLRFPTALSEKQGLALAKWLNDTPDGGTTLRATLTDSAPETAAQELAILSDAISGTARAAQKHPNPPAEVTLSRGLKLRQLRNGRIEISGPRTADPAYVARLIKTLKALK